jgi:hypothetical protein
MSLDIFTLLYQIPLLSKQTMTNIHFFTLPRELRDMIYFHTLSDRIILVQEDCDKSLGLLLASHQLRSETLDALNRSLPRITIVVPCTARALFSGSDFLRQRTRKLVIQRVVKRCDLWDFVLEPVNSSTAALHCAKVFECMPALREVMYEISWDNTSGPSVLLPSLKERMISELRRVTVGEDEVAGWGVECRIKDATRWKIGWSGVVILRKMQEGTCS